jgi:hypothetical protein
MWPGTDLLPLWINRGHQSQPVKLVVPESLLVVCSRAMAQPGYALALGPLNAKQNGRYNYPCCSLRARFERSRIWEDRNRQTSDGGRMGSSLWLFVLIGGRDPRVVSSKCKQQDTAAATTTKPVPALALDLRLWATALSRRYFSRVFAGANNVVGVDVNAGVDVQPLTRRDSSPLM